MEFFDGFAEKGRLEEFYNDIINGVLFDTPVQYTVKYPEIENYGQIIKSRQSLEAMLKAFVSGKSDNEQDINEFLVQYAQTVSTDILKVLRKLLRMKRNQIRRQITQKIISLDGNVLVNFNWRVNLVVSHSNFAKCMRPVCTVEFIIKVRGQAEEQRVNVQMQKDELLQLIDKFKQMQQAMK